MNIEALGCHVVRSATYPKNLYQILLPNDVKFDVASEMVSYIENVILSHSI